MRPVTTSPASRRVAEPGHTEESGRPPAGPGKKRRRPGGEAMTPATRRRLADVCGYAAMTVVLVIIALYEYVLDTKLNEITAPTIMPVMMVLIVIFDKLLSRKDKPEDLPEYAALIERRSYKPSMPPGETSSA